MLVEGAPRWGAMAALDFCSAFCLAAAGTRERAGWELLLMVDALFGPPLTVRLALLAEASCS